MSAEIDDAIDRLHRTGRLRGRVVHAFGHTAATEALRRRLAAHGIRLASVLDNNPAKQGGSLGGVPVRPPDSILAARAPVTVLIASRFHAEMRRQLEELGFAGEIIRVGGSSIATAAAPEGDPQRGGRRLARLRAAHPGRHLLVCPFGAFGDVYWALAYLPAFLAERGLPPAVPVVVGERCREVARLFGLAEVDSLDQAEMDDLVSGLAVTSAPDVTIAHHDRPWGPGAAARVLEERFVAFTDLYRELVYGLSDRIEARIPRRDGTEGGDRRPAVADLPRGRTVLLAPHAKSVLPVAPSFWTETAARWVGDGFTVATLVHGEEEAVPGTRPLTVAIADLLDLTEHAGTFIGLRSGLCDLVHTARARKIHVSPDAYYSTTRHKVADFFALPGWESVVLPVG